MTTRPLLLGQAVVRCAVAYYALLGPPPGIAQARFSAREQIGPDGAAIPPLLIARAGRDAPALNASVDAFVRAALEKGVTLDFLTHPAGRHAFDLFDDDARSRTVIRRTLAFLGENLAAP